MGKKRSHFRHSRTPNFPVVGGRPVIGKSSEKGKVLERIVAELHEFDRVGEVRRNVLLPALHDPSRTREIDVLLTGRVCGYEVNLAIECKNYASKIGAPKIGEFADKLSDVGLPVQGSIFVSASGFTADALSRASDYGIRTLVATGLSQDRLGSLIEEAVSSTIYLLPTYKRYRIDVASVDDMSIEPRTLNRIEKSMGIMTDANGQRFVTIPDIVAMAWKSGVIKPRIATTSVEINVNSDVNRVFSDGMWLKVSKVTLDLTIQGLAISCPSQVMRHELVNTKSGLVEKCGLWERSIGGRFMPTLLHSEKEARSYLRKVATNLHVTNRILVPRIQFNGLYHPLSQRVIAELANSGRKLTKDEVRRIAGSDSLNAAFEE